MAGNPPVCPQFIHPGLPGGLSGLSPLSNQLSWVRAHQGLAPLLTGRLERRGFVPPALPPCPGPYFFVRPQRYRSDRQNMADRSPAAGLRPPAGGLPPMACFL